MRNILLLGLLCVLLLGCSSDRSASDVRPLAPPVEDHGECIYKSEYFYIYGECDFVAEQLRDHEEFRTIILADYVIKGLRDVNPALVKALQVVLSDAMTFVQTPEGHGIVKVVMGQFSIDDEYKPITSKCVVESSLKKSILQSEGLTTVKDAGWIKR